MNIFKRIFRFGKKTAKKAEPVIKEAEKVLDTEEFKDKLAAEIRRQVVEAINKKMDIPVLNEKQEAFFIGVAYDAVTKFGINYLKEKLNK